MADIRINDLPPDATPSAADNMAVDGLTTRRSTIEEVVLVGRPTASQAEAEAGVDNVKAMTPLTVVQSIAANGATQAQGALADTALQPGNIGGSVQGYYDALQSMGSGGIAANQIFYGTGTNALSTTALTPFARTLIDDADATAMRATLMLGTAAIANVTTSQTDTTSGRVTRVGDFGIGAQISIPSLDLDLATYGFGGNNSISNTPTNTPTAAPNSRWAWATIGNDNSSLQIAARTDSSNAVYWRGRAVGTWNPVWYQFITTKEMPILDIVSPEQFGAVGNGVTDDSTAMLAWFAEVRAGKAGWLSAGKNYLITSGNTLTSTNEPVIIYGNGATITQNSNSRHMVIGNTYENIVPVSSFTSMDYDFGGGNTPITRVNLTAPRLALFEVGDMVKVGGDAVIPTEETDQREGEFAQVGAKDGSGLILTKKIQFPVGANPIVGRLRTEIKVHLQDIFFDHIGFNDTTAWANNRVMFQCAFQPSMVNVVSLHSASQAFQWSGCLQQSTVNCAAYNARTYTPANALGYGFVEKHSEGGVHVNMRGYNCRHVFTTVAQSTSAGDGDLMNRGRNKYARIVGGNAGSCTNAAWDTHADSYGTEFIGCCATYPYAGNGGERMNYQLRGINDRTVSCKSYGSARGYFINRVGSQPSTAQAGYCSFIDCEHVGDASDTTFENAFQVSGDPGTPVPFALIQDCRFQRNGSTAPFIRVDDADVQIINPQIVGPNSTSGNYFDFLGNEGAIIRGRGGYSNNIGSHASASYRPFRGDEPGTHFDWKGYDIRTESGKFFAVVNAVNASGGLECTAFIRDVTTNIAPSALTSVGTQITNGIWVDINGGVDVAYNGNANTEAYSTSGNKTLSISRRGGALVWVDVTTTSSGVAINNINDGAFAGQMLTIRANTTSTQNLQITSGSGITLGGNVTLTPGDALRLIWTGSSWARA